jgi:hypothetical protein
MASPNTNWSEILTTTLYNRSGKLADSVTKNNAILRRLGSKSKIKTVDGGAAILQEIEYSENGTYKRYSGYDILNISPSDVFTSAQFGWAQAAVAVSISGLEELQNSGKERIFNLLESRIANAERTFKNNLSNDMYSNGTADGGKQIGGLQLLVADVATSGVVGGIDRALWPFWRPQNLSFAALALTPGSATIQTAMNRMWLNLSRGGDHPDLILADNTYYRYYWESLQAIQRITSTDEGMAGFSALKFMTADVVFDGGFQGVAAGTGPVLGSGVTWLGTAGTTTGEPANHMYFLTTDYIYLRPHKDRNMVPISPDRFAVNQDATVKLVGWAGNMTVSNCFLQGALIA